MSFVMSAGLVQIETALDQVGKQNGDRCVLLQKCFRHFDVDTVGTDEVHLSLFEMPGSFSFGPDGREDIIPGMWHLLTETLGINQEHLWVTYFAGDLSEHDLVRDSKTYRVWRELGVPEERLVGLGIENNFWRQGGGISGMERWRKCGPNTEVFFDRGVQLACGSDCWPGCHCGRFVEIANSLFVNMEVDSESGEFRAMARPFAETVIGTERVAMILQGKNSVFEIDDVFPIISIIRQFHRAPELPKHTVAVSEKVIADHFRALMFLVADGAPPPGKDGRQRIIKILIRRVLTHQYLLNIRDPEFLPVLAEGLTHVHKDSPKLTDARVPLLTFFAAESRRFEQTITKAQRELERFLIEYNGGRTLCGEQIVCLEKTWGMPHILVKQALHQKGLSFDEVGYQNALAYWRQSPET
jgi:alanyl-tRNA synthetase